MAKNNCENCQKLRNELTRVTIDRDAWRAHVIEKFRWFMQTHRDGKVPLLPWLIENMGSFILGRLL